jgi:hypothetical protein
MEIISKLVYQGLKRKKSNHEESIRLGLSITDYKTIKRAVVDALQNIKENTEINDDFFIAIEKTLYIPSIKKHDDKVLEVHHDLEKGTSKMVGVSTFEPKTPEEVIKLLCIDTTKWKLSQFWNKEQPNGKWLISALITKLPQEQVIQSSFLEQLSQYELPVYDKIGPAYINENSSEKVCGVISLQDLHFGKPGNENMGDIMDKAIWYLIGKAYANYNLEKVIFVIGPDTLNMDTFDGTTTKGTPVENSEVATKAYMKAFDAICLAIGKIKHFCDKLEVVFIPGNHDRLSSFHLIHAVSQVFKMTPEIIFNTSYKERKVTMYYDNMIALEHGDISSKNNPLVYAVEFPEEWGKSTHRILYTGHYHGRKTKEVITENEEQGFVTRIIPALTSSDYYHYHNKWTGNQRAAIIHIHEKTKGLVAEFTYTL